MKIKALDHVNVRTTQLETMIAWYSDVLGLVKGPRPNFASEGAWMYAGDAPVVHLVAIDGAPGVGSEVALKLEHFAFSASGRAAFEARLKAHGAEYKAVPIDAIGMVQLNVWDPDGNHIHIDFAAEEV